MCDCASCHLPHVDGQVDSSLIIVIIELCCMLCKQFTWVTIMLICDQSVGKVGIWYVLHHLWKKC
jgi:hypothetical protein